MLKTDESKAVLNKMDQATLKIQIIEPFKDVLCFLEHT
jgi:hypothetical protein